VLAQDLKNPFHTLLGMTELLRKSTDNNKRAHYIEGVHSSAKTIYEFFENLVLWMSVQSKGNEAHPELLNLSELTEEVCDFLQPHADAKSLIIKNHTTPSQMFYGDYTMINAVIRNLISNAIKYTPRKGEIIIHSKTQVMEEMPVLEVSVQDSGIGISPDQVGHIFQSDKVQSSPGTEGERGTGIGLLLCKEFIEKNNGKIRVESEYGKGSTFTFQLPAIVEKTRFSPS
jgi:signal transduction histidine kinase